MTTETLHMVVEGGFVTQLLRTFWMEREEYKAIKTWKDTFPELADTSYLNSILLKIVSGRKKFTGDSDGPNGLQLEDDKGDYTILGSHKIDRKREFILQSWDDVILRKQIILFFEMMTLKKFQMKSRAWPAREEDCNHNTRHWAYAADENELENPQRERVDKLYTELENIGIALERKIIPFTIHEGGTSLGTYSFLNHVAWQSYGKKQTASEMNLEAYRKGVQTIMPHITVLNKKYYGLDVCGIDNEMLMDLYDISLEELTLNNLNVYTGYATGIKIDVDTFVQKQIDEAKLHEKGVVSDKIEKTKFSSGYISPEGVFYPCADLGHREFAEDLCRHINLAAGNDQDYQIALDKAGFCKLTMSRFAWQGEITIKQKDAIWDYMTGHNISATQFNGINNLTYKQQFKE